MLLIKNANLDGTGKIVDILIGDDGKYKEIAGHIEAPAGVETIDATGMMACPTFVNTHMHFDKAYTSYEQGRESYGKGQLDLFYRRNPRRLHLCHARPYPQVYS